MDYNILSDSWKDNKNLNGSLELSAEQAHLEVANALQNNLLGQPFGLATEDEWGWAVPQVSATERIEATALV